MDENEAQQTGASKRWVNLALMPWMPDWAMILLEKEDPSHFIFTKLSDEALCEVLTWALVLAPDPAALEEGYEFLVLFFRAHGIGDFVLLNKIYLEMWNHFTGGRL